MLESMTAPGYSSGVAVAIEGPATNLLYPNAESDTERVGRELAALIETFSDNGVARIRLISHSLGS